MKNVTITLDEKVADWARIWAAKNRSSVSKIVGETLKKLMQQELGYTSAMNEFLAPNSTILKRSGKYPPRESLHER